jgi:hypothetical protein
MPARDVLRYVVAAIVGIFMFVSGSSPWTTLGVIVLGVTVVAFAWHLHLAQARRADE